MIPHKCKQCGNIVEYKNEHPYSISYLANFWCKTCDAWKFPHNVEEVKEEQKWLSVQNVREY